MRNEVLGEGRFAAERLQKGIRHLILWLLVWIKEIRKLHNVRVLRETWSRFLRESLMRRSYSHLLPQARQFASRGFSSVASDVAVDVDRDQSCCHGAVKRT